MVGLRIRARNALRDFRALGIDHVGLLLPDLLNNARQQFGIGVDVPDHELDIQASAFEIVHKAFVSLGAFPMDNNKNLEFLAGNFLRCGQGTATGKQQRHRCTSLQYAPAVHLVRWLGCTHSMVFARSMKCETLLPCLCRL